MGKVWAKILEQLRSGNNFSLFGLISSIDNITFEENKIVIHTTSDLEFTTLQKNKKHLEELAGGVIIEIEKSIAQASGHTHEYIEKLENLFGDKLKVL